MLARQESQTIRRAQQIRVRFFAQAKEAAGTDGLVLDLEEAQSARWVRDEIIRMYPDVGPVIQRSALAVNRQYVTLGHLINPGDELAIIPPVAGG